MLKKVMLGIVVGAIVFSTSAGFLWAYPGGPGGRQGIFQQSSTAAENDGICTNENCPNYGENCPYYDDCEDCQNYQNCQGFQNLQGYNRQNIFLRNRFRIIQ